MESSPHRPRICRRNTKNQLKYLRIQKTEVRQGTHLISKVTVI